MLSGHPTVLPTSASQLQQTVVKKRHPNASPNLTPIPTRLCPQKVPQGGGGAWRIAAATNIPANARNPPSFDDLSGNPFRRDTLAISSPSISHIPNNFAPRSYPGGRGVPSTAHPPPSCHQLPRKLVLRCPQEKSSDFRAVPRQAVHRRHPVARARTRHPRLPLSHARSGDSERRQAHRPRIRDGPFVDEGKIADVFPPGLYTLNTKNLPLLTDLKNWDKDFESPFKSDVYFFSTHLEIDQKWGTATPITLRDKEFGAVRVRAYGIYSYRIADPRTFFTQVSGTRESYHVSDLEDQLRNTIVARMTDIFANSTLSYLDMTANDGRAGRQGPRPDQAVLHRARPRTHPVRRRKHLAARRAAEVPRRSASA
jgi:hypothetical protein